MTLVRVLSPVPAEAWDDVLRRDPAAGVTQTREWAACVCAAGPFEDSSRFYTFADGRRIVLPLARRRGLPQAIAPEASWPFDWSVGGPVSDGPVSEAHARAVYADLEERHGLSISVRPGPGADSAWSAAPAAFRRTTYHTSVLDLRDGFEHVWTNRFRSSTRRAVRKAEKSRLRVEVDHTGALIPVFEHLYRESVARWATQQHEPLRLARWRSRRANPPIKFETVAELLGARCAVWVAYAGDEPAAAIIVLRHGRHAKYWRGAMNVDLASPVRANDLLHRLAIEAACADGCRSYHMGDSRPGSGLARFKAGFGATAHVGASYRLERLPLTAAQDRVRRLVKRAVRFQDA